MAEKAPIFEHERVTIHENGSGVRIEGKDAAGRTRFTLIVQEGRCISIAFVDPGSDCTTRIVWEEGTSEGG